MVVQGSDTHWNLVATSTQTLLFLFAGKKSLNPTGSFEVPNSSVFIFENVSQVKAGIYNSWEWFSTLTGLGFFLFFIFLLLHISKNEV